MLKQKLNKFIGYSINKVLGMRGYQIGRVPPTYDEKLKDLYQELFNEDSNITIFDVGAHLGESVQRFRSIFPRSIIHSFEPDPSTFEKLSTNTHGLDNLYLNNFGLTNKENVGSQILYRHSDSKLNSRLKINTWGASASHHVEHAKVDTASSYRSQWVSQLNRPVTVDFTTIDKYVSKNNITAIDILKLDVQGQEPDCLDGAINSLDTVKAIYLELIFSDLYEKSLSFYDVEKLLISRNFKLYRLFRATQNKYNFGTSELEVLYINKDNFGT